MPIKPVRNPDQTLAALGESVAALDAVILHPDEAAWLLAQLKHKDDQLSELRALVMRKVPATEAPTETVCQEADRLTSTDRQAAYGHPYYAFTQVAQFWEIILDLPTGSLTPDKVTLCMAALKIARQLYKPKRDNMVDAIGYLKLAQVCLEFDPKDQP